MTVASTILAAGHEDLRRILTDRFAHDRNPDTLFLKGQLAPHVDNQNAGNLLQWRLEDLDGNVHAAIYEKLILRPSRVNGDAIWARDWLKEARAYSGLRKENSQRSPELSSDAIRWEGPTYLGIRRHNTCIGLLISDLEFSGWRVVTIDQALDKCDLITNALASFAIDNQRLRPDLFQPWTLPGHRPFFTDLTDTKLDQINQFLDQSGQTADERAQISSELRDLHESFDWIVANSDLPFMPAHGDPYFRNMLFRPECSNECVALIDYESVCTAPAGLDVARFMGTTITRNFQARARDQHQRINTPGRSDKLNDLNGIFAFIRQCEARTIWHFQGAGVAINSQHLRNFNRTIILLCMCYAARILLESSIIAPDLAAPIAQYMHKKCNL